MANPDEQKDGAGGNETVVVGLVKRVMGVEARLVSPSTETVQEEIAPLPSTRGNVQVETKVMDAPRKKATSIRTMSDFKI